MITKLLIMLFLGIGVGLCMGWVLTDWHYYREELEKEKEIDNSLRNMEQFYISEYFENGKEK